MMKKIWTLIETSQNNQHRYTIYATIWDKTNSQAYVLVDLFEVVLKKKHK